MLTGSINQIDKPYLGGMFWSPVVNSENTGETKETS